MTVPSSGDFLVVHSDNWRYRPGTSEPSATWTSDAEATLDGSWLTGPGGFGYGDGDDATELSGMMNVYSTVYTRKDFVVTGGEDLSRHLILVMDYDDAYVAWINGVEVARSASAGTSGTPVPYNALATANREAVAGGGPAPEVVDLGPASDWLQTGTNILAIQAINGTLNSSDLTLIADLSLAGNGVITGNTTWTPENGVIHVASPILIGTNATLTIAAGTELRFAPSAEIDIQGGGHFVVAGEDGQRVLLRSETPGTYWLGIQASGSHAGMTLQYADVSNSFIRAVSGATGLVEDCTVTAYAPNPSAIIFTDGSPQFVLRRSLVSGYHETNFKNSLALLEDCLFENYNNVNSDGIDFDYAIPGSTIRRCTVRKGPQTNSDAIDIGSQSLGVLIADCALYNTTDKGVSIGEDSFGIVVTNCLIHTADIGISVKDSCTAAVFNSTIVACDRGIKCNRKTGTEGGHVTNSFNTILWANAVNLEVLDGGTFTGTYHNVESGALPGEGNLSIDPEFLDFANFDLRVSAQSPMRGAGFAGADIGVTFPVGGLPNTPTGLQVSDAGGGNLNLIWNDEAPNESGVLIERSTNGVDWVLVPLHGIDLTTHLLPSSGGAGLDFFRLAATNFIGKSYLSNPASIASLPGDVDGDGLQDVWESVYLLNPYDPADALLDSDSDGMNNLAEQNGGTNPRDDSSRLLIDALAAPSSGQVAFRFPAVANHAYAVLYTDHLESGSWGLLATYPADPADRQIPVSDNLPLGVGHRYYQIVTPIP